MSKNKDIDKTIANDIYKALIVDRKKIHSIGLYSMKLNDYKKAFQEETNNDIRIIGYNEKKIKFDEINNNNEKIKLLYSLCKNDNKKWIIAIHDFLGSKEQIFHFVKFYNDLDFNVLCYDVRGHGNSDFNNNFFSFGIFEINDLDIILKWINKKFNCNIIGIVGFGVGAYIANNFILLNKNDKYKIKFVISDSTFFSYHSFLKKIILKFAKKIIPNEYLNKIDYVTDLYIKYCKENFNLDINKIQLSSIFDNAISSVPTFYFCSSNNDYSLPQESIAWLTNRIKFEINDFFYDLENIQNSWGFIEKTDEYICEIKEFLESLNLN